MLRSDSRSVALESKPDQPLFLQPIVTRDVRQAIKQSNIKAVAYVRIKRGGGEVAIGTSSPSHHLALGSLGVSPPISPTLLAGDVSGELLPTAATISPMNSSCSCGLRPPGPNLDEDVDAAEDHEPFLPSPELLTTEGRRGSVLGRASIPNPFVDVGRAGVLGPPSKSRESGRKSAAG